MTGISIKNFQKEHQLHNNRTKTATVLILVSFLATIMFAGGWLAPFEFLAWIPGVIWLGLKAVMFMFLFLWFRATFPRYRYDQIMRLGWKIFIPVTLVWIIFEAFAIQYKLQPWFNT